MPKAVAIVVISLGLGASGCAREAPTPVATLDSTATEHAPGARRIFTIVDLHSPESARYDAEQDAYLISNMLGFGSVKDDNGYISRVSATNPERIENFIQGGRNGVTLHAPKGMALHGDTLWVTDIDVLRAFDRRSGAPLATIDFSSRGAVLLNDIVVGPDDRLYVTDTGIDMSPKGVIYVGGDRIFAVGPGNTVSVVAEGPQLGRPNGITWDVAKRRLLFVTFEPFSSRLYSMTPGDTSRTQLAMGKGKFDGVEVLPDGRILYTAWTDSSVHLVEGDRDRRVIFPVPAAADIGVDTRRNRVVVPVSMSDRVEIWQLPARDDG